MPGEVFWRSGLSWLDSRDVHQALVESITKKYIHHIVMFRWSCDFATHPMPI
jgi:hypothetical protein